MDPHEDSTDAASFDGVEVQLAKLLENRDDLSWVSQVDPRRKFRLPLMESVDLAGKSYDHLVFKVPRGSVLRAMPAGEQTIGHFMDLGARLCGVIPKLMDLLDPDDLRNVMQVTQVFTNRFRPTG